MMVDDIVTDSPSNCFQNEGASTSQSKSEESKKEEDITVLPRKEVRYFQGFNI